MRSVGDNEGANQVRISSAVGSGQQLHSQTGVGSEVPRVYDTVMCAVRVLRAPTGVCDNSHVCSLCV